MSGPQVYLSNPTGGVCRCGGKLSVDVERHVLAGVVAWRFKIFPYEVAEDEKVARCYCEVCGLMYHPAAVFKEASL